MLGIHQYYIRDQRHQNWVFSYYPNSKSRKPELWPEYQFLSERCHKCHQIDRIALLLQHGIPDGVTLKVRAGTDVLCTNDSILCYSKSAKSVIDDHGITGLDFLPFPNDPFYVVIPTVFAPIHSKKNTCSVCGYTYADRAWLEDFDLRGIQEKSFFSTSPLGRGSYAYSLYFFTPVMKILKNAKLKGMDIETTPIPEA